MYNKIIALLHDFREKNSAHCRILDLHPSFRAHNGSHWFINGKYRRTSDEIIVMAFKGELTVEDAAKSLVTLTRLPVPVPWETECWLTNGGNVLCLNRHGECWFSKPSGEFIRQVSHDEAEHLMSVCHKISGLDITTPELPVWHKIASLETLADYSKYKPETSINGGDYAFFQTQEFFIGKVNGGWILRSVLSYSTSAEFGYDELTGRFQQNCNNMAVMNCANPCSYWTQDNRDVVLEQISEVVPFEYLWNLTHETYYGDDESEDLSSGLSFKERKSIVAAIKAATGYDNLKKMASKQRSMRKGGRR